MAQTISTDFIPDVTGRDLGTPAKRWDAYLRDVDISGNFTAANLVAVALNTAAQIVSTLPDGTAPLSVLSQTKVANLNVDLLDGKDWASPLAIGTGTPAAANFTTLGVSGQITSSLATGTAPINVASTTKCPNLNADLLDGADWTNPPAMGAGTAIPSIVATAATITTGIVTNDTITNLTLAGSVAQNGAGLKIKSITTGSVPASGGADVTLTWTTAFADTSYAVFTSVEDATTGLSTLSVTQVISKLAASVKVRVRNVDAGAAHTGTLWVLAIRFA